MSASARLFNKLRETLGEEPARDLIAYIAEAREVSRVEVREVAELYLSRFDERLRSLLVEHEAKIEKRFAEQDMKIERRFGEQDAKLAAIRIEFADRMAVQHKELLRWLFAFWAGTIIPLAGLMIALSKL